MHQISAPALAALLDVNVATARHWLSGRRTPPPIPAEIIRLVLEWQTAAPESGKSSGPRTTDGPSNG